MSEVRLRLRQVTSEWSCSSSDAMEGPEMVATVDVEMSMIQSASWASLSRLTSLLLDARTIQALDGRCCGNSLCKNFPC